MTTWPIVPANVRVLLSQRQYSYVHVRYHGTSDNTGTASARWSTCLALAHAAPNCLSTPCISATTLFSPMHMRSIVRSVLPPIIGDTFTIEQLLLIALHQLACFQVVSC